MTNGRSRRNKRGSALVVALGILALFSALGAAYVRFARLEMDQTTHELRELYALNAARAGVHAALAQLQQAGAIYTPPTEELVFEFPVYTDFEKGLPVEGGRVTTARVQVFDEEALVNINHAPVHVLQAVLGLPGNQARQIRQRLPLDGPTGDDGQRWLTSLRDLVRFELLSEEDYLAVDRDLLTVYTVEDPEQPRNYINLNTASAAVLAAVLNVDGETARRVVAARPFRSLGDVLAVTGNSPSMFNVKPPTDDPYGMPRELTFTTNCFRIRSTGVWDDSRPQRSVEAVVLLDEENGPVFRYWNENVDNE